MGYITLTNGLTLTIPTSGTKNWGQTLQNSTWAKISSHDHTGGGNGSKIGSSGLQPNIALTVGATLTPSGTTQTIDFSTGNIQNLNLSSATGTVTLTLQNPVVGACYTIWVQQGATFRDLVFPVSVKWPQAQAPILTQTASALDCVKLYYNGTNYLGDWQVDWS